jgi:hypothetical protein
VSTAKLSELVVRPNAPKAWLGIASETMIPKITPKQCVQRIKAERGLAQPLTTTILPQRFSCSEVIKVFTTKLPHETAIHHPQNW